MTYPKTLYVFRGLPGSGKTTAANKLGCLVVSPQDMFAMRNGEYKWKEVFTDPKARDKARALAELTVMHCLSSGCDIAVAEVLPKIKAVKKWENFAENFLANFVVTDLIISVEESLARNIHNVPENTIRSMADNFEPWET